MNKIEDKNTSTKDMTKGSPFRHILLFMMPVLIGNVFQQVYSLVDSVIVGRYVGENALAAIGSTGSLTFFVIGWINGFTSGFAVMVSQAFGAGDEKRLKHYTGISMWLCIAFAILMTGGLLLLNDPILTLMKTPETIYADTDAYITIIYAGIAATIAYNMLAALIRALGDSRTPLYFLVISSIINVILDYAFVVKMDMGCAGAGYATIISQTVSAVLCFIYMLKKFPILRITREDMIFKWGIAWKLLSVGIPMGLQFSITAIGTIIVQAALNGLGETYIAAYTACSRIQNIITQPFPSIGAAIATYTGQNAGAGRIDRVKKGVNAGIILSAITATIATVVILFFGNDLVKIFGSEDGSQMLSYCGIYFDRVVAFYFPLSLIFVYRNVLQGLGKGLVPMLGGVSELIARYVIVLLLTAPLGFAGVCWANAGAWMSALIPLIPVYYFYMRKTSRIAEV